MTANPPTRGRIIVFGIAFWYPLAGVTWQFLHYLIGLRRLGFDVYYVEDSDRWVYDPTVDDLTPDASRNVARIGRILDDHGFAGRWIFRGDRQSKQCYGMTEPQFQTLYREADAFLNVTGGQELREEHMPCPRRLYVETDPVASQIEVAKGNPLITNQLAAHTHHFTFGENFGASDCLVPLQRFNWQPTRQPVLLDFWESPPPSAGAYTTIASWTNKGKDIVYNGQTYYWSKDREFARFIDLPQRRSIPFELATTTDPGVTRMLSEHGWRHVDSVQASRTLETYRTYIQNSRGEFTVAKDQNIRLRSGWFSDRSACYLAAGRPVITQETGFSNIFPTGHGLFGFATMDDILAAVDRIETDYPAACRAAGDIAREYFSAERVLASLMQRAGLM